VCLISSFYAKHPSIGVVQVDDTELVKGLVFDHKASHTAGGPTRIENAKIGLIQFQISPPKTDIEQSVIVSDYTQVSPFVNLDFYFH